MSPRSALPLRLEYVVLGLIRRKPEHGYELLQRWKDPGGISLIWQVKPGPLYTVLTKLEGIGHLDSSLIPGEASPPEKNTTSLPRVSRLFWTGCKSPVLAARDFRQDFLAKLYFEKDVNPSHTGNTFCSPVGHLPEMACLFRETIRMPVATEFERQVFSFRVCQVQGILTWLGELAAKRNHSSSGDQR